MPILPVSRHIPLSFSLSNDSPSNHLHLPSPPLAVSLLSQTLSLSPFTYLYLPLPPYLFLLPLAPSLPSSISCLSPSSYLPLSLSLYASVL